MRIKKNSYIKGKGSGDAPFFFTQNFFEKNIFFSLKPLNKIEKVWYNIYTEKENPKGHRKALKELKEPEKEKIMKTINQFITDHSLQNKVTPRGVFPDDEARVVFYNGIEVFLTLSFTSAEEAERSGLIDKKAKYQYAKDFLEKRGVTFDADTMQALIDSTCWELFNQFKKDSDSDAESEA